MEFLINDDELNALCGLPHMQQLAYLRGIRPYMDVMTGLVGIKRGISYQSIAEQLYVEPHQGFKTETCSRMQVRRSLSALERAGLIISQSQPLKLILKCELATRGFSVQNKVDPKQTQQADTFNQSHLIENKIFFEGKTLKADIGKTAKAATPLIEDNYIYLLSQFEKFWFVYPEKKSRQSAWQSFQLINPDHALFNQMLEALQKQIKNREEKQLINTWLPPWKYPANWLTQRCWEDEMTKDNTQENKHANHRKSSGNEPAKDPFWNPTEPDDDSTKNNIIPFQRYQSPK